jgi:hypothetical protein
MLILLAVLVLVVGSAELADMVVACPCMEAVAELLNADSPYLEVGASVVIVASAAWEDASVR